MTGWVWAGIIIGVAIVALAVGIPFLHTHKRMSPPLDRSEGAGYVRAKRRWRRRRAEASEPTQAGSGQGTRGL
ncbi:MAG: hypothetical protein JO132_02025 [Streptosporangiaceae bacterium]|nr:hypothetical protein [Streptosporangiaceae bacterium]